MNNLVAGIGDVLLRYPELIEDLTAEDRIVFDRLPARYAAVHLASAMPNKIPPRPEILIDQLKLSGTPFVVVGSERFGTKPKLRTHIEVVRRATCFIGTLSCFNVVAQLAKVPSFVIVNRAVKEPFIYGLMTENGARVEPWNNFEKPRSIESIYYEAADWALDLTREPRP